MELAKWVKNIDVRFCLFLDERQIYEFKGNITRRALTLHITLHKLKFVNQNIAIPSLYITIHSQILYMKLKIIVSNNEFETRVQQRPIGQPKQ